MELTIVKSLGTIGMPETAGKIIKIQEFISRFIEIRL